MFGSARVAATIAIFACGVAASPDDRILKRDNGKLSGKEGKAQAPFGIEFQVPDGEWYVRSILVFAARYGDQEPRPFDVAICDGKLHPRQRVDDVQAFFRPNFRWVEVPIPPLRVEGGFTVLVDFKSTHARGVYVGACDTSESHSFYGRPGGRRYASKGRKEWMIRARISPDDVPLAADSWRTAKAIRKRKGRDTPIVWDPAGAFPKRWDVDPGAPLDDIRGRGESCLVQWGVVFISRRRLKPTRQTEPNSHAGRRLYDALHHRRIDVLTDKETLRAAVKRIARWFEAGLEWRVDGDGPAVTLDADSLLGRDALDLLLVPRGYTWRLTDRTIVVTPKR